MEWHSRSKWHECFRGEKGKPAALSAYRRETRAVPDFSKVIPIKMLAKTPSASAAAGWKPAPTAWRAKPNLLFEGGLGPPRHANPAEKSFRRGVITVTCRVSPMTFESSRLHRALLHSNELIPNCWCGTNQGAIVALLRCAPKDTRPSRHAA